MTNVGLLSAHLRGEHSNERLPECAACEGLPPVSMEVQPPVRENVERVLAEGLQTRRAPTGRKCGCGCGSNVARRYLPGHDAKHKSRLIREARSGSEAAKRELEEHGWSKFL